MGSAYGLAIILQLAVVAACGLVGSAVLTAVALRYARRRGLLDQPGKRRSHTQPTPRGGGVGIVAAALLVGLPAWCWLDPATSPSRIAAIALAILAVAVIGWRDDHAPLAVLPRLLVHVFAALLVVAAALAPATWPGTFGWLALVPLVVLLVGFINAHNFMDGIDGILGLQALFVLTGYGLLAVATGRMGIAGFAFVIAGGCLGFLLFNLPPARVFMGDVGSGALGLAIGAVAVLLVQQDAGMLWGCLILPSAFLVDSGFTLARRAAGGQRWYAPHRQHLYQWLVRVKWSHARTDAAYMTWNFVVVTPLTVLAIRWPVSGVWCAVAAYVAAGCAWLIGKHACLTSVRRRTFHEFA